MTAERIVERAKADGVQLVRFLYCDNGGLIRAKAAHVRSLPGRLRAGIGLSSAMQVMNMFDVLSPREDLGLGPSGEVRMVPDPSTYRHLPYAPKSGGMISDLLTLDQQPWGACPRSFLKGQIARAAALGLRLRLAFENEWAVLRREGERFVPACEQVYASTIAFQEMEPVIQELIAALEAQGLEVESYYPEYADGQMELTTGPADALEGADNQVWFRETVRAVFQKHGLVATFMPKPFTDDAGNGSHLHLSIWDMEGAQNLLYAPGDALGLSELAYHFIGGLLSHLPALIALTCPSVNSYRRLQPSSWSSAYICYGYDNREAPVRIVSPGRGQEATSTHLELRTVDGACNPYLAAGAVIAAGLDGIQRRLAPGEPVTINPANLDSLERELRSIRLVPGSLESALDELAGDLVLREALGEMLFESFVTVKRSEVEFCRGKDFEFEQRHHVHKF